MHIVLCAVNAKYIHSNLAVHSIRAYAAKRGVHLDVLEFTINDTFENLYARLLTEHADVLAFSCYVWNIVCVKELICEYSKVSPETEIWIILFAVVSCFAKKDSTVCTSGIPVRTFLCRSLM